MDLIIGVIAVVVWLIIQGAAASKKGKPPSTTPPVSSDPGEPVSPGDELRKFFENMQKEMAGDADRKPAPPPPPQPQKPRRPPRPRPASRLPHEARPAPVPQPVAALEPVAAQELAMPALAGIPAAQAVPTVVGHRPMPVCRWAKGYDDRETLRKMMVAREVLGPPLALRRAPAGTVSA